MARVGQNHVYGIICRELFLSNVQSYAAYIYGFGRPTHVTFFHVPRKRSTIWPPRAKDQTQQGQKEQRGLGPLRALDLDSVACLQC